MDRNFYNKMSSKKLGWEPEWFGEDQFDDCLVEKVKQFQRKMSLVDDGLVGPLTHRRLMTAREAEIEMAEASSEHIICNGERVPIAWNKVISMEDAGALALPHSCYNSHRETWQRTPTMIVTHWDAALSAKSCYNILKKREISSHFVIDNDGTIYQMVDTQHTCWHAGNRAVNNCSIGIDFSNAYYTKYQDVYVKRGHGHRPVLKNSKVHGRKLKDHLGYYPIQIQAYKALLKSLADYYNIPLECPTDNDGKLLTAVSREARTAKYEGVVCHYHITNRKIDCAGLELAKIIRDIGNKKD